MAHRDYNYTIYDWYITFINSFFISLLRGSWSNINGQKFTKMVQVKVNNEEDTERGEYMHIKGCEHNSNWPIIAYNSWSACLYIY